MIGQSRALAAGLRELGVRPLPVHQLPEGLQVGGAGVAVVCSSIQQQHNQWVTSSLTITDVLHPYSPM